jgi:uncharacterized coiled-coil protein SlyX
LQLIPQTYYKGITVSRGLHYIPKVAIFLAGVAAGALSNGSRRGRGPRCVDPGVIDGLKKTLADLETRVAAQEAGTAVHLQQIDEQLQEHAAKLADVPSTSQIIAAMDQLLSKSMSSLDQRLTTQAQSIEVLKTTISQTDSLLERVLESLDSLQACSEPSELQDTLLQRPAV